MKRVILSCCVFLLLKNIGFAQNQNSDLAAFFQSRLTTDTPVPSYEALLRVIDPIANSSPQDITTALPFVSAALKSDKENLPVEAAFAFYAIAQRPDAGTLLRSKVSDIGALLESSDDRLSGGAIMTLRFLIPSSSDLVFPILMKHLNGPAKPNLVKVEIVSILLQYKSNDSQAVKSIEAFFASKAEPRVRIATLQAIAANRTNIAPVSDFTLQSLNDSDKFIKRAAIYTAHALGPKVWSLAQPAVNRIAADPSEDKEVRAIAEKELNNSTATLSH